MNKRATKIAVATLSAGITALICWYFLPRNEAADIQFQRAGRSIATARNDPATPPARDVVLASEDARVEGLPDALSVGEARFPPSTFQRRPLDRDEVLALFPNDPHCEYDPYCYYRKKPHLDLTFQSAAHPEGRWHMRTNSAGYRNDLEVAEHPDLRVIVSGDSHTDGVCNNSESFAHLVEEWLADRRAGKQVEVLNASTGGYSFYNYLGVLERSLPLRPDVFVVAVYGGNDFDEALAVYHFFNGTVRPPGEQAYWPQIEKAIAINPTLVAQAFLSHKFFTVHPEQMGIAAQMARDVVTEIQVTCLRQGIGLVVVYIPPFTDVQGEHFAEPIRLACEALGLSAAKLDTSNRMADALMAFLEERKIAHVDMRGPFREARELLYWKKDCHINLAGQRLVAEHLAPIVDALVPEGAERVRPPGAATLFQNPSARAALDSPGSPPREPDPH